MKQRIITAIALIAVIFPCVFFGGIPFQILMGAISVMCVFELLSICTHSKANIYLYGLLGAFTLYSLYFVQDLMIPSAFILLFLLVLLTCSMFDYGMPFIRLCYYFTATVLVATGLHMIYYLRIHYDFSYIFLLALATFGSDTGAYFAGSRFGKHKLNPRLSPKKTIEGSIGGILFGSIISIVYGMYAQINMPIYFLVIVCVVLTITGQIGDLTFSAIKRFFEVKDYSQIFPGHGGCLDRFDSLLFNAASLGILLYYISMVVKL